MHLLLQESDPDLKINQEKLVTKLLTDNQELLQDMVADDGKSAVTAHEK